MRRRRASATASATRTTAPPAAKREPATQAELERLEKKIAEQQRMLEKLLRLQQQYLQSLVALMPDGGPRHAGAVDAVAKVEPRASRSRPRRSARPDRERRAEASAKPATKPIRAAKPTEAARERRTGKGRHVVGKVKGGGGDAYVYIEDIVRRPRQGRGDDEAGGQAVRRRAWLVVQKGTTVEFPNLDAIFHNVFSVTPDNSFDLGSYRQGEVEVA